MSKYLQVDRLGNLRDQHNRVVVLRGINLDGGTKIPSIPSFSTFDPIDETYWDGDNVSFINRPFSISEAPQHLSRIQSWGYNVIRYVYTWEAIEHKGPKNYDDDFIDFSISVLKMLEQYGFKVFMDPHQDVWSRYSGGSGAPMWTLYAAGLNPRSFVATEAALVQNTWPDPEQFPKMIWASNYLRLACQTMFTLFFAGMEFAPKAIIDGKNIQEYLQLHCLEAMRYFYNRIQDETDLFEETIIGVETFNEPNPGLIGNENITKLPAANNNLKLGNTPTAFQGMLLGSGRKCEVDSYVMGSLGPKKSGKATVDPKGVSVWLPEDYDDSHYGWSRDPGWKLGTCLWAQHGVWDPNTDEVLKADYFSYTPQGEFIDEDLFVNVYFHRYWSSFFMGMRELNKDMFLLCQPPVWAIPPNLKDSPFMDKRVIYAPHYYDGLSLVQKTWNKWWNVDVLGILRGRYATPALGMKFGESNIRKCMRDQLKAIRQEGLDHMGPIPCLMSETGMPFDMDDKAAYKSGNYSSQISALDAISFSLEGSMLHHTYWVYVALNSHRCGDYWNGEDFSFYSRERVKDDEGDDMNSDGYEEDTLSYRTTNSQSSMIYHDLDPEAKARRYYYRIKKYDSKQKVLGGSRANDAIIRPFPLATVGILEEYGFDLSSLVFKMKVKAEATSKAIATEIFLPSYHYSPENIAVEMTSGRWHLNEDTSILFWWHEEGDQSIKIQPLDIAEKATCCTIM